LPTNIRRFAAQRFLNFVQLCDPAQHLGGERRSMNDMEIMEFAPGVRPASGFPYSPGVINGIEPGVKWCTT
jgi:hypothetical protein